MRRRIWARGALVGGIVASVLSAGCLNVSVDLSGIAGDAGAGSTSLDPDSGAAADATVPLADAGSPADADSVRDAATAPDAARDAAATPDAGPPAIQFLGRFDFGDPTKPTAEWSGSAMQARFRGTSLAAKLGGSVHYFEVIVDGVVQPTLVSDGGASYPLVRGLDAGPHDVLVFRRDEATFQASEFLGFDFGDGGELLPPAPAATHRIEIIGDSISCGFGVECANASDGFTAATENEYIAYGPLTARAFGADVHVEAWSGKGMYRNLDGSTTETVPLLWQRTIPTEATSAWDPSRWVPDAVVINLGTNDYDAAGADPSANYQATYLDFVSHLKSVYPNVFVFGAVGPMLGGTRYDSVKTAIANVVAMRKAAGDDRMQLVEFPTQNCGADAASCGCGGHPNAAEHQKMAKVLSDAIQSALGW